MNEEWLALMARVKAIRDTLYFSRRRRFDEELRPEAASGKGVIAYPDAIYHITAADVNRAEAAVK